MLDNYENFPPNPKITVPDNAKRTKNPCNVNRLSYITLMTCKTAINDGK